jgi:hypothetical protein
MHPRKSNPGTPRKMSSEAISNAGAKSLIENSPFANDQELFLRAFKESAQATQKEIEEDWEMKRKSLEQ